MKKIRIFDVPWHVSHQYSTMNIPNTEWGLLKNNVRNWNTDARPLPKNVKWVPYYEEGKYDLAILHVDQQCVDPLIGKGILYRNLNQVIQDIPKIVINHGTPWWPERWSDYGGLTWAKPDNCKKQKDFEKYHMDFLINGGKVAISTEMIKVDDTKAIIGNELIDIEGEKYIRKVKESAEIEGMKKLIGDNLMVVNSHRAKEMWGWGEVIIHGLDKDEWFDLPKEPRVIVGLSAGGLDSYYGRDLLDRVRELLSDIYGIKLIHVGDGKDWTIERHSSFSGRAMERWDGFTCYRDFLSRSLLYFNPTIESPMPRSRTEAMLSGCCVLTTPYHDADSFINCDLSEIWNNAEGTDEFLRVVDELIVKGKDVINGFLVPIGEVTKRPVPQAICALINHLMYKRFKEAVQIGQNGRRTAHEIFGKKRYDGEWTDLINKVIGGKNETNFKKSRCL